MLLHVKLRSTSHQLSIRLKRSIQSPSTSSSRLNHFSKALKTSLETSRSKRRSKCYAVRMDEKGMKKNICTRGTVGWFSHMFCQIHAFSLRRNRWEGGRSRVTSSHVYIAFVMCENTTLKPWKSCRQQIQPEHSHCRRAHGSKSPWHIAPPLSHGKVMALCCLQGTPRSEEDIKKR